MENLMLGMPRRFTNQNVDGMITTNLNNGAVGDGKLFQVYSKITILTATTHNVAFTTPSDKDILVMPTVISTSADKLTFRYYEGATFTGGTLITPVNQNRQSTNTSGVVVRGGVTVSTQGTQLAQVWMAGAESVGQTRTGGSSGGGETHWRLKRNTTYILSFQNESASSNIVQFNEIWIEE